MFNRIVVSALWFYLAANASAAAVPRYAQELRKYGEASGDRAHPARVRIALAGDVLEPEQAVRLGDVLLCSAAECYRARTAGFTDIAATSAGKAEVIADVYMPAVTITDVYFTEVAGRSVVGGHLKLESALAIGNEFPAVELMIAVRKQPGKQSGKQSEKKSEKQATYLPVQSASMPFADDSELVHYLPSTRTVAALSLGTTLTIPAGALDRAQIFNVGIIKVGEMFPKIDILPYLDLKKPGTVEVRALRSAPASRDLVVPAEPAQHGDDALTQDAAARPTARLTMSRTTAIQPGLLEKSWSARTGAPEPAAATSPPKSCAEYLAQPIVLGLINLVAVNTGAARVMACEKIKPYIHIAYVLLKHDRINFSIPYQGVSGGSGAGPTLALQRITTFGAAPSTALINGFTWEGDRGFFDGDTGKALGIVRSNGVALGDNVVGGGAGCPGCAVDDLKFVMAFAGDKANPAFLSTRSFRDVAAGARNVASTSTSVIKNGVCQTPGTPSRWSAVGAFNGRMVLISSTTGGQTSAAELCAVFKALAIKDALRLDGGPSAAMMVSGELLNPLEGWDRAKYGQSRRIAYPLRISR